MPTSSHAPRRTSARVWSSPSWTPASARSAGGWRWRRPARDPDGSSARTTGSSSPPSTRWAARSSAVSLASAAGPAATFDGRDVFAPAAGALCAGAELADLGDPVDASTLGAVPPFVVEQGETFDRRRLVRAEVTWADRFGNLQLAAGPAHLDDDVRVVTAGVAGAGPALGFARVRTFADLAPGGTGLLVDADGRLALVVREGSAALALGAVPGDLVELVW